MSIVNTTPDSFYDGGQYNTIEKALQKVEIDIANDATFIDIGGYSSKPNATHVTEDNHVKKKLHKVFKRRPTPLEHGLVII